MTKPEEFPQTGITILGFWIYYCYWLSVLLDLSHIYLVFCILLFCSSLKKKLKDKMAEFQVRLSRISVLDFFPKSPILQLNFFSSKSLQTLRGAIHQEYREVVERRVFTGWSCLLISGCFQFYAIWMLLIYFPWCGVNIMYSMVSMIVSNGSKSWWGGNCFTWIFINGSKYVL